MQQPGKRQSQVRRSGQEISIDEGETVEVLGWSYPVDGSDRIAWLYVRTANGIEGWMQSREEPGPAYPDCAGIDPKANPATFAVPTRAP
jgi:hypothetical protein